MVGQKYRDITGVLTFPPVFKICVIKKCGPRTIMLESKYGHTQEKPYSFVVLCNQSLDQ